LRLDSPEHRLGHTWNRRQFHFLVFERTLKTAHDGARLVVHLGQVTGCGSSSVASGSAYHGPAAGLRPLFASRRGCPLAMTSATPTRAPIVHLPGVDVSWGSTKQPVKKQTIRFQSVMTLLRTYKPRAHTQIDGIFPILRYYSLLNGR
jgi:hypothetical protein